MESEYDIVIIGGGPIGGHIASLIAKQGHSVLIIEEHKEIGEPMECAGIFSPKVLDIVGCEDTVLNRIKGADIYSPQGKKISICAKEDKAVVVDRTKFDKRIVTNATGKGAELILDSRALDAKLKKGKVETTVLHEGKKSVVQSKLLIGADGVKSNVAKWFNLPKAPVLLPGYEAEMTGADWADNKVGIFVGNDVAPGFFAWVIPADNLIRVGLCTRKSTRRHFEKLLSHENLRGFLKDTKPVRFIGGAIPLGMVEKTFGKRVMIAGDAASQVKATSGGGIYPGLVCATHCAKTALEALERNDFSERFLARYHKRWMNEIGKELKRDWLLYRIFQTLNDERIEKGIELLNNPEVLGVIEERGDIDYPSKLVLPIIKKEPRLLRYATSTLKDLILRFEYL